MKIQLWILALFVVATLAHRHRDDDDENQIGSRRFYRGRRRNDNQIAANAEDAELEDSVSSENDNVTERSHRRGGCGSRRGGKRGERKGARGPENEDVDVRFGDENSNDDNHRHNSDWHEKHGVPMPDGSETERKHHRHHKHHHHHHNRTTTTPATTTTPSANE